MSPLSNLSKYKILLASKSPRRRELLEMLRIPFNTISISGIEENYPVNMPFKEVPLYLANLKGDAYSKLLKDNELIITADTLVIGDDGIYGKPADTDDAKKMIGRLAGKTHNVITGVCIISGSKRISFTTETKVKSAQLSEDEIEYYVANFHPYDKAGAYGIQEWIGGVAVEWIDGSYYNVMGLPLHRLYQELKKF